MRRRAWAAAALGAALTLTATAALNGVVLRSGSLAGSVVDLPAQAAEMTAFDSCEELRRWYVGAALPHVTPWGLGGSWAPVPVDLDRYAATAAAAGPEGAVASGATGTNLQEAGVDEPDVAKTDGSLVAHLAGRRLVLTDTSRDEPRRLSTLRLPRRLTGPELLLVDDRLVVLGTAWDGPAELDRRASTDAAVDNDVMFPTPPASTRALVVDVADPSAPRVVHDVTFDGTLLSARQYEDVVRLVVSTSTPAIDFVRPRRGLSPRKARAENRRRVRESHIEDWLPSARTGGAASRLVDCDQVAHPEGTSGYGTVTVVGLDPDAPDARRTTAVTTSSDLVYSSADRLYLGTPRRHGTGVHAFALAGLDAVYLATGRVPGRPRDRWSFSERDGRLRVATALGRDPWNPTENAVVILEERGRRLAEVGRVDRMGIREQVRSVRWFGDLAVVVTFRQVDPLYTVDLSDPTVPRVVGELKVPGFSSYLHPVGDDLLLGLGQDASRRGVTRGAQAAVFDLADLARPERLDTEAFGRDTELAASWDPRIFTYLPDRRTALTTMLGRHPHLEVVELRVGADGRLSRGRSHPVRGWDPEQVRVLPVDDGRAALVARGAVRLLDWS